MRPKELKTLFEKGENLSKLLQKKEGSSCNTEKNIEISYDIQAGSYVSAMEGEEYRKAKQEYSAEIAKVILRLGEATTILEAGVGEGTTLSGVFKNLASNMIKAYGFDISWSRVFYARKWLKNQNISDVTLCTGSLCHIPFADNSMDIVYTSHSIESNGGNERAILQELYRITRNYLVLIEPGYELVNKKIQQRMDYYGYCKNLKGISEQIGYEVIEHQLFYPSLNLLNPSATTIIRKLTTANKPQNILACPEFKTPLRRYSNLYYSPEAFAVYPIIDGIPCLRIENGIIASKFLEISEVA